jgi:hypothetical protein
MYTRKRREEEGERKEDYAEMQGHRGAGTREQELAAAFSARTSSHILADLKDLLHYFIYVFV